MKEAQSAKDVTNRSLEEATREWVRGFNSIPQSLIKKAYTSKNIDNIREITPVSKGSSVYINGGDHNGESGDVIGIDKDTAKIMLDNGNEILENIKYLEVQQNVFLPFWDTMWMFDDGLDNRWLEKDNGLQLLADCGFRIYEIEEGKIFGIDGAGYDFYESHWLPLYKARFATA